MPLDQLALRRCRVVAWVVADDLDHLDRAEGGRQQPEGRELVIVDLRHATIMPLLWPRQAAKLTSIEWSAVNGLTPRGRQPFG